MLLCKYTDLDKEEVHAKCVAVIMVHQVLSQSLQILFEIVFFQYAKVGNEKTYATPVYLKTRKLKRRCKGNSISAFTFFFICA
jgi:hypothetical protein